MKSTTIYPFRTDVLQDLKATKPVLEQMISAFNRRMDSVRQPTQVSVRDIMRAAEKVSGMQSEWNSGLFAVREMQTTNADPFGFGAMLLEVFGQSTNSVFEFYPSPESRDVAQEQLEAEAKHLQELLAEAIADIPKLAKSRKKNKQFLVEENAAAIANLRSLLENFALREPDFDMLKVEIQWTVQFIEGNMHFAPAFCGQYLDKSAGEFDFMPLLNALGIYSFSLPVYGLVSCENHPTIKWCLRYEMLDLMREVAPVIAREAGQFIVTPGDMFELLKPLGVDVNKITNVGIAARMLAQLDGLNKK